MHSQHLSYLNSESDVYTEQHANNASNGQNVGGGQVLPEGPLKATFNAPVAKGSSRSSADKEHNDDTVKTQITYQLPSGTTITVQSQNKGVATQEIKPATLKSEFAKFVSGKAVSKLS